MTAGTATLGLLPLLVSRLHGTEIERPLAIVMIGGLATSTLFTLLVLPTFYLQVHGWLERRAAREECEPASGTLIRPATGLAVATRCRSLRSPLQRLLSWLFSHSSALRLISCNCGWRSAASACAAFDA
jgi:predicted RND superfamily exporter protein